MSTPTTELTYCDLCKFWDQYGLFLGIVEPVYVDVKPDTEKQITVKFLLKGEPTFRYSYLHCSYQITMFEESDFTFIALLIDGGVKILPRIENRQGLSFDDGLQRICAVNLS